jgi:hypothetical protein
MPASTRESTTHTPTGPRGSKAIGTKGNASVDPLSTLRGAGVTVDSRRVTRVFLGAGLAAVAALVITLFVAGVDKNAQITQLREHGIAVGITVTGCRGLLGGSGSNPVGYACSGTYTVDGRRYTKAIPGNTLLAMGTTVRGVSAQGDPALISTPRLLANEHASWKVFLLPTVIVVVALLLLGAVVWQRMRRADGFAGA